MSVSSLNRVISRRAPRLSSFTVSVWSLLLAACGGGGGGGGGGPVASGPVARKPVASGPVASDPERPLPATQEPAEDNGTPLSPKSPPNDPQHRDDSLSDATQIRTQVTDPVPVRMEILPLVSLPTRPSSDTDQWIKIADIRVLNRGGEEIQGNWSYAADDTRFRADDTGLYVRAGSNFSNSVSENLDVRVTMRQASGKQLSQTTEVEIVSRADSLELHIYENHPFHKPIAYLTAASGWRLDGGEGDNALFHVDATGRVWFIGTPRVPLLDFERPADSGGDNIYQLRLTRTVDGREEALNLSVQVHDIVNERNWAQRHDYHGLLGRSREADLHHEVPDELEHVMHGSHWVMPSSGPLVLTWSLRTLFSPDQMNAGRRPSPSELLAYDWQTTDGQRVRSDLKFLNSVRKIEALRHELNSVFEALQQHVNIRFIEVDESSDSAGHFRIWLFNNPNKGFFEAQTIGQARFPMGQGWKYIKLLSGHASHSTNHLMPHEIGHLLGLKHPWHGTHHGWDTDGRSEPESKQRTDTVMSYNNFGVSGWQEIDLRILQLIYGAAAGVDDSNPSGHRPLAGRQETSVRPERDLFDGRSTFRIEMLEPAQDSDVSTTLNGPVAAPGSIYAKIFPDETGSKKLIDVRFIVPGASVADGRVSPMVGGIFSTLFELRPTPDKTVFALYIRDVDALPFYSIFPGWGGVNDFRFNQDIYLFFGPQFHPVKIHVQLTTASEPDGEFLFNGRPVVGGGLRIGFYDDDKGYWKDIQDDASYEWRRDGDETILSTKASFRPVTPGNYTIKISLPDPQWRYTAVVERQIEVRAEHDPKQSYDVVRFEGLHHFNQQNPPASQHDGTDAAEWFDIERPMTISGGGGADIFAPSYGSVAFGGLPSSITDFTKGEDKIWLFSASVRAAIAFRHVDTDNDDIVDATLIGTSYKPRFERATFTPFLRLDNFTETLEESDFLLDGGDLLLVQWPDMI